ncbi:MAG: DSD1 family PLP-dependent enzyme [Deinococcales bacterium]|nr:DSD1 family PLP-dependent enzyme [Deinococcales bacterium]
MTKIGLPKSDLDTPALWLDLEALENNISYLARYFEKAEVEWRPHIKGIKVPALAHKLLNAGAIGITCAKLGEAEVMVAAGVKDILIANQIVTSQKIERLVRLCDQAEIKVAVDNADNVAALGVAASTAGIELGVLVEVNCGMDRAGVSPGEPTAGLAETINETPGLRFRGIMSWEGHVLAIEDPAVKCRAIDEAMIKVTASVTSCEKRGLPCEIISCGGGGTAEYTPFRGVATEIQAGGLVLADAQYRRWNGLTQPALYVRTTVTSRPTPKRIITDAGRKSLPFTNSAQEPDPIGLPPLESLTASAEHGILTLREEDPTIKVGDGIDFLVGYGDITVAMHDHMYGIRNGIIETIWPISGRGKFN